MTLRNGWDVDTVVQLMFEHYKADYDRKKEYLLKMVEVCDGRKVRQWYEVCKQELHSKDFGKVSAPPAARISPWGWMWGMD